MGSDSIKNFSGKSYSLQNTEFEFEEVADIIRILKWDTDYFGFPIALVGSKYLTTNIQLLIDHFAKDNRLKLSQYLCNCHDDISVKVAEKSGYHFTDIRLTFQYKLNSEVEALTIDPSCMTANESHLVDLIAMTEDLYKDSRYFYDGNFDLNRINQFYSEWIVKAVKGTFDHECYVWFENEIPVAFCTIRYSLYNMANIGLFGVHKDSAGKGYGKKLLFSVIQILATKKVKTIEVVTQGRNYAAQRLYQSIGFKTKVTELWYHKWHE
jgi:dTDP-4-amino-4,6-dideoxy-D-galactose acyltransferase